jgi:hypothetical protein
VGNYLVSVPFFGPKAQRLALIRGRFYPLLDVRAYHPSSPRYPQWQQWLLDWARTWGGEEEQRAQLLRFLPSVEVEELLSLSPTEGKDPSPDDSHSESLKPPTFGWAPLSSVVPIPLSGVPFSSVNNISFRRN